MAEDGLERRYQSLVRFGQRLQGVVRLTPLLTLIADEVRLILDAARCSIFLVDEERQELWTQVAHGLDRKVLRTPLDKGIIGAVVASGSPIRLPDAYDDPRFNPEVDRDTGFRTKGILAVPFKDQQGRTFGVFEVLNKRLGDFDADDEALLQILGTLASQALASARHYEALHDSYVETVHRLARATEYRDTQDTASHLRRIAVYTRILAEAADLTPDRVDALEAASPLHDIGKVAISDAVLKKTGKLTPAEFEEMKQHTLRGWEILRDSKSPLLRLAAEIALTHHERFDGTGYPNGIKGAELTLDSQLVALADVFDALTVQRVYKAAWTFEDCAAYLVQQSGALFNPAVVAAFQRAREAMRSALAEQQTAPAQEIPSCLPRS